MEHSAKKAHFMNIDMRSYVPGDDDAALAAIAHEVTGEPYSAEKIAYDLSIPGIDALRDVTVCEIDGIVSGYAVLSVDDVKDVRQGRLTSRIAQDAPLFPDAEREILLWAARRIHDEIDAADRPVTLIELAKEEDLARCEFLEDAGFRTIRYYRIMLFADAANLVEIPLPAGHSYIHGPGRAGADEYVAMFNDTWIDHYGFIPLTRESVLHDIDDDPEYDPTLDIVVERDGRFVGFAFCRLEPSDPDRGEVMAIGVRRGFRGVGLGRILLSHAVSTLVEHGAREVELTVDSDNPTHAGRLYESVGFKDIAMKRRYQLDQDGIIRLATLNSC